MSDNLPTFQAPTISWDDTGDSYVPPSSRNLSAAQRKRLIEHFECDVPILIGARDDTTASLIRRGLLTYVGLGMRKSTSLTPSGKQATRKALAIEADALASID